jgi:hypothetical protein
MLAHLRARLGLRPARQRGGELGDSGGISPVAGIALMLPMEAGIAIPIPSDLVMLAVGARVSAGDIPLPVAVPAFEAVAIAGTSALFLAARGPGHGLARRLCPRIGFTQARLDRLRRDRTARPGGAGGRPGHPWPAHPDRPGAGRLGTAGSPGAARRYHRKHRVPATAPVPRILPPGRA